MSNINLTTLTYFRGVETITLEKDGRTIHINNSSGRIEKGANLISERAEAIFKEMEDNRQLKNEKVRYYQDMEAFFWD